MEKTDIIITATFDLPPEKIDEVVIETEKLMDKEESMKKDILVGLDILEVDQKYNYEQMLKK